MVWGRVFGHLIEGAFSQCMVGRLDGEKERTRRLVENQGGVFL